MKRLGINDVVVVGLVSVVLEGGYFFVVRFVWFFCDVGINVDIFLEGFFCWMGGEDGWFCRWSEDCDVNERSIVWVFSGLVVKRVGCLKFRYVFY